MRTPGLIGSPFFVAHCPECTFASHSYDASGAHSFAHVSSVGKTRTCGSFAAAASMPMQRDSAHVLPAGGGGGGGRFV